MVSLLRERQLDIDSGCTIALRHHQLRDNATGGLKTKEGLRAKQTATTPKKSQCHDDFRKITFNLHDIRELERSPLVWDRSPENLFSIVGPKSFMTLSYRSPG